LAGPVESDGLHLICNACRYYANQLFVNSRSFGNWKKCQIHYQLLKTLLCLTFCF